MQENQLVQLGICTVCRRVAASSLKPIDTTSLDHKSQFVCNLSSTSTLLFGMSFYIDGHSLVATNHPVRLDGISLAQVESAMSNDCLEATAAESSWCALI